MRKTIWIVCSTIIVVSLVFGFGYLQGRRAGTRIMDSIVSEYRGQLNSLGRNLSEARRNSESIRNGIESAQDSITESTRGLENSLASISRLGSVTAQIRGLAQAIRTHVEALRATTAILETVHNNIDIVIPDSANILE